MWKLFLCFNKEWFVKLMFKFLILCICNLKVNYNFEKIIFYKNFKKENICLNELIIFSLNLKLRSKVIVI